MPPKAAVEDFDDDFEFDLPSISSREVAQSQAQAGGPAGAQPDQMAAFQKMMEQMGQGGQGGADYGAARPPLANGPAVGGSGTQADNDGEHKKWVSVYPIYFDAKRHYGKGCRRVSYEKSSPFPTQLWLAKAAGRLNMLYVQEPYKTHPQDWENPGRIKVKLVDDEGSPLNKQYTTKKQLFDAIADIIQPECGGKPPALEPRKKRTSPTTLKKQALEANAKSASASGSSAATSGQSKKKPQGKGQPQTAASVKSVKPTLTKEQRKQIFKARRDPNPNPLRQRLAQIKFPPMLEMRLPAHSPALEGGLLNMNMAEAMGGMPPGGADALGPLQGMLGSMGLGGDDDDDEDEEQEAQEDASKKKDPMNPLNLGRRQRKKMVRVGR